MKLLANLLTALVAVIHIGILTMEVFLWEHPTVQKIFLMTPELSKATVALAINQGTYNGFLAAGLVWGLLKNRVDVKAFFLSCVIIAAIVGAITVKPTILLSQGGPAILALIFVLLSARNKNP